MQHNLANTRYETPLEDPEFALAQRYNGEIERLLTELWTALPSYRKGAGEKTYHLVRENLEVLTDCFHTNALSVPALGVLRDHLWMLSRLLAYRMTEAKRHLQHS